MCECACVSVYTCACVHLQCDAVPEGARQVSDERVPDVEVLDDELLMGPRWTEGGR